jgi:hypothetical protein
MVDGVEGRVLQSISWLSACRGTTPTIHHKSTQTIFNLFIPYTSLSHRGSPPPTQLSPTPRLSKTISSQMRIYTCGLKDQLAFPCRPSCAAKMTNSLMYPWPMMYPYRKRSQTRRKTKRNPRSMQMVQLHLDAKSKNRTKCLHAWKRNFFCSTSAASANAKHCNNLENKNSRPPKEIAAE